MATAHSRIAEAPPGIPARVREARTAAGLSQGELATRLGLDGQAGQLALSRIERGASELSLELAVRLAAELRVSLAWLGTGQGRGPRARNG